MAKALTERQAKALAIFKAGGNIDKGMMAALIHKGALIGDNDRDVPSQKVARKTDDATYVIYREDTTAIVEVTRYRPYKVTSSYKGMRAAKAALTRMSKEYAKDLSKYCISKDPQFIYGIAEINHYYDRIEKQVTRTGVTPGSGKEVTITMSVNEVGGVCDPFTERYWSM
jgi:hypothetical protein